MLIQDQVRSISFRGKARLLSPLYPRSGVKKAKLFGYLVELDLSDHIQRHIYMGTYERTETHLVRSYLRPGMTFLDVGANVGYYSLMAARHCGENGSVLSFEPNPSCFAQLQKTIQTNRISTIQAEPLALSDIETTSSLFTPRESGNNTATMVTHAGEGPSVPVQTATLDEYLDAHQIGHVDFMKIDVEGFEPAVMRGAQKSIHAGRIARILYESNGPWLRQAGTTPMDLYKFVSSLGMKAAEEPSEQTLEWGNILVSASRS